MHLEHKAFEMQIIYAPINLPEVSSRLSLNVKAKAASKLYLKCPELPGSTQRLVCTMVWDLRQQQINLNLVALTCAAHECYKLSQKQNKNFGY